MMRPAISSTSSSKRKKYSWSCSTQTILLSIVLSLLVSLNFQRSFLYPSVSSLWDAETWLVFQQDRDFHSQSETVRRRVRDDLQDESSSSSIRSWGCNRTAVPFIFVHIGKAGGGNVRRRIATAALHVTRTAVDWKNSRADQHYYPTHRSNSSTTTTSSSNSNSNSQYNNKAKFCSSGRRRHLPVVAKSFEGHSQLCTATTPLGHVLACPEMFNQQCVPYDPRDPASAHLVYVGHNALGTELHWLPIPYLQGWWQYHWNTQKDDDDSKHIHNAVMAKLETLDGIQPWCRGFVRRLRRQNPSAHEYSNYTQCAQQILEPEADALAQASLQQTFGRDILDLPQHRGRAYGQMYASLPVTRVTILREPISWLLSKWSWHKLGTNKYNITLPCDDIELATKIRHDDVDEDDVRVPVLETETRPGWVRIMSLRYILSLCGEDCYARWESTTTTTTTTTALLEEVEAQAAYNLRNSFAVVGLLHEQDSFFEMLHERVDYLDLHLDHAEIFGDGGDHMSLKNQYCQERFQTEQFQQDLVAASPELQALIRLYRIGVQVNSFQMRELEECSGRTLSVMENQTRYHFQQQPRRQQKRYNHPHPRHGKPRQ